MKAILGNAFVAIKEYQMKVAPASPLNPPFLGDFERLGSPPAWGIWGADREIISLLLPKLYFRALAQRFTSAGIEGDRSSFISARLQNQLIVFIK